jgi:exonuclease VII small subunit
LNQAQVDTIVSAIENGEAEKLTSGRFALDKVTENFKEDHATCQAILKEPI